MFSFEDFLPDVASFCTAQVDLLGALASLGLLLQLVEGVDTILCLRATSLGLTTHPIEFSAIEVEGTLTSLIFGFVSLLALGEVVVIVTSITVGLPSV